MDGHRHPDDRLLTVVQNPTYEVAQEIPPAQHAHGSVRRVSHGGHEIEIHTHYRVVIDGVDFPDPFHVMNDGTVGYHGLPQYSTASAVDLATRIVDELLTEEPPPIDGPQEPGGHDRSHGKGR